VTRYSLLYTMPRHRLLGTLISQPDGGEASHVGVRLGDQVIDASFWHGVAVWPLAEWLKDKHLVADVPVVPRTPGMGDQAEINLRARIGQRYDWLELLGFILLRDLGDPNRPICSRLGQDFLRDACGLVIPWRTGRWGVRLNHTSAVSYLQGLLARDNDIESGQSHATLS